MGQLLTLHQPRQAKAYYQTALWQNDTLYSLVHTWAKKKGDAFALRDSSRRVTWSELKASIDQVAAELDTAGLVPGDRVSVWMSSRVEAVIVFLACSRNGYVFNTSLHRTYTVHEVMVLLERVSCRALFAEQAYGADGIDFDILARAATLQSMRKVFGLPSRTGGQLEAAIRAFPSGGQSNHPSPMTDPDKIVYLAFTSGTTGTPKAVMHSDNTLLANARAMIQDWGHAEETILLTLSQMSHHIGTVALSQALVGGFELVLSDPITGVHPVDWINETGATYVMGVPTHAIDILAALEARSIGKLGQVATFYMAGALIPTETARKLLAMGIKPQNVYGMTENGSHQYTLPTHDMTAITETCGKCCAAYEIKLFHPEHSDVEVKQGEVGEIGGRGAMRMLGYFGNQEATESSFNASGWFMSGDLGCFDASGNLRIVGRTKDMIIRGGHNIHPSRIEDLTMKHPKVVKAAAVPVPDERLGEKVCLVVQSVDGKDIDSDQILGHLSSEGLSIYDMPEYFAILPALPLGPTGKILKRELAEKVKDGRLPITAIRWRGYPRESES
jgi:acyl-CoA synthetase